MLFIYRQIPGFAIDAVCAGKQEMLDAVLGRSFQKVDVSLDVNVQHFIGLRRVRLGKMVDDVYILHCFLNRFPILNPSLNDFQIWSF